MKNLIIALFVLLVSAGVANSQYLACSTYTSNTEDSIAVSSSTDAASDNFTAVGGQEVWLQIHNGTFWYTFKIDFPSKNVTQFKVSMGGSDTTCTVQATTGGETITVPLIAVSQSSTAAEGRVFTLDLTATARFRVKFYSFPSKQ